MVSTNLRGGNFDLSSFKTSNDANCEYKVLAYLIITNSKQKIQHHILW